MIDQPSKCLGRGDKEQKSKEGGKGGTGVSEICFIPLMRSVLLKISVITSIFFVFIDF